MKHSMPTEVFEAILANLDMRDLLLAQRVSRRWRDVITASPTLQQKLFMQPIPRRNDSTTEPNPLLESIFPALFRQLEGPERFGHKSGEKVAFDDHQLNRLFANTNNYSHEEERQEAFKWLRDRPALLRGEASWRRMFAAKPPPRTFVISDEVCNCLCHYSINRDRGVLGDEEPGQRVRLGVLYDMVISFYEETLGGKTPCSLDWFLALSDSVGDDDDEAEARGASIGKHARPPPAVIVRNMTWMHCSGDSTPGETGVKIADFDMKLIDWIELETDDLQEFNFDAFDSDVED
ncbi:hypothetical protein CONLIGDRAFT_283836 [Coniochaeta ligniaria NRRL 30616]|uniref:F-box domain-containing protein n=1 Tax=Coniochaeta ligniaria NRRL 30616 TaxID=1408157 RepID=A0A1J7JMM3_9PEZI|nr:hypothetical protein CONLIGDRAFT_283836 [Coniochaeta ligniaria NRRL 30616]